MKKLLIPIAAFIVICLTGCGSTGTAVLQQFGLDSKAARADFITSLIGDGFEALVADSTSFLVGTWTFTDNEGTYDTLWFYSDSTVTNHFVSKKDTINLLQTGGYLYYSSYKQALVQYNGAHNYLTRRDIPEWNFTYIYGVSKFKVSALGLNQLTMSELDQTTGEVLSQTTYTYQNQ
ncbi:MAG: hypothetical protein KBT20_09525 [Bacteroidales bacterium]|nr:hypothetical protein [Candidatus Liminaster caballi]